MNEANQSTNVKTMIEFDQEHSNSIKADVKVTSRFINCCLSKPYRYR